MSQRNLMESSQGHLDTLADEAVAVNLLARDMDEMSVDVFYGLDDIELDREEPKKPSKDTGYIKASSPLSEAAESPVPLSKRTWKAPRPATPATRVAVKSESELDEDEEQQRPADGDRRKKTPSAPIPKRKTLTLPRSSPSPPWMDPGTTLVPSPPSPPLRAKAEIPAPQMYKPIAPAVDDDELQPYKAGAGAWTGDDSPHRRISRMMTTGQRWSDEEDAILDSGSPDLLAIESQGQKHLVLDSTTKVVFDTPAKMSTSTSAVKMTPRIRGRYRESIEDDEIEPPDTDEIVLVDDISPVSVPSDIDAARKRRRAKRDRSARRDDDEQDLSSSGAYQIRKAFEIPDAQPLDGDFDYMSQRPEVLYFTDQTSDDEIEMDDDNNSGEEDEMQASAKRARVASPPPSQKRNADSEAFAYRAGVLERHIFVGADEEEATALFIVQIRNQPRRVNGIKIARDCIATIYDPVSDGQAITRTRQLHLVHRSDDGLTQVYRITGNVSFTTLSAMVRYLAYRTDQRAQSRLPADEYLDIRYYWSFWMGGAI